MSFKVGDKIFVTKITSIFRVSKDMPKVGEIYVIETVREDFTDENYRICISTKDNLAFVRGVKPTELLMELV